MEITIKTQYDQKAMTALARGLRKTVRKKHSRRSNIFGWIVVVMAAILVLSAKEINGKVIFTGLAGLMIVLAFLFEDALNGMIAMKRGIPGLHSAVTTFREDGYHSKTEVGESDFPYAPIVAMAESKDYFLLLIGPSHGQVYDKRGFLSGTAEDFRRLLEEKTGKTFQKV